ncbi:unnamed protein product, partial [Prorocentrum cordatum]
MSARGPGTGAAVVLAGPPPPVALANHSCDPNAEVVFACDAGGARATLRALRPIAPGEEVVHSYIRRGGAAEEAPGGLRLRLPLRALCGRRPAEVTRGGLRPRLPLRALCGRRPADVTQRGGAAAARPARAGQPRRVW